MSDLAPVYGSTSYPGVSYLRTDPGSGWSGDTKQNPLLNGGGRVLNYMLPQQVMTLHLQGVGVSFDAHKIYFLLHNSIFFSPPF